MINQRTIEQVYERADIVDVVSDYVELRKAGVNYKGLCPFHQDHAPSLIVSPAKNICKCFACGKGGNPVSFVMAMEGCSYPEAVERLARKYNIEVRREGDGETLEQERQRRKRESAMVIYEAVTEFYRQRLLDDDPKAKAALCYVRSRWDCRERDGKADDWDRDYATMARVGYAPDRWTALVDFARQKGYDLKLMEEVGLSVRNLRFYKSQPWSFTDTLMVGFWCEVDGDPQITVDRSELKEARWFTRDEIPLERTNDRASMTGEMIERFRTMGRAAWE